jgi:hypothetical protein
MAKKNFKSGFDSLLGGNENNSPENSKMVEESRETESEIRATFILSEYHHKSIKAISYWERKMLKDILYEALEAYISEYKKDNGEIIFPHK